MCVHYSGASASNSFSIKSGVDARVWHCGKASAALKVGFSQRYVNEERKNASVGQSDWFLVCLHTQLCS